MMIWCPMAGRDCRDDCAWFAERECSLARLHDISDSLDAIQESLIELDDTIKRKKFSE